MTIPFENDKEVIRYASEEIIDYTRKNRYIFVALSMWWIASIIGLTEDLVTHIDDLYIGSETTQSSIEGIERLSVDDEVSPTAEDKANPVAVNWFSKTVSTPPRNIQKDPSIYKYLGSIHPDRISIIDNMTQDLSESDSGRVS